MEDLLLAMRKGKGKCLLTPTGHRQPASNPHPYLHRWAHTQSCSGDPSACSHS